MEGNVFDGKQEQMNSICLQHVLGLTVRVVGRDGHYDTGQTETQAGTQRAAVLLLLRCLH